MAGCAEPGRTQIVIRTAPVCRRPSVPPSRAGLAPLSGVEEVRIDWRWTPAWRPADITDSGREQLRAIGFTI